jgi:hypothetical protein
MNGTMNTSYYAVWGGLISGGSLLRLTTSVGGPYHSNFPVILRSGNTASGNYEGWEWNANGAIFTTAAIRANVVTLGVPGSGQGYRHNIPGGAWADAAMTQWVGLCDASYCAHRILQTGYEQDATNPYSSYNFGLPYAAWWENYAPGSWFHGPQNPYFIWNGHTLTRLTTTPGHTTVQYISYGCQSCFFGFAVYYMGMYDSTTGTGSFIHTYTDSVWAPRYAESIGELGYGPGCSGGHSSSSHYAQIPTFNSMTSTFPWGLPTRGHGAYSQQTLYNAGWWTSWTADQFPFNGNCPTTSAYNAQEAFNSGNGVLTYTWVTSNYDWTCT